jgi:uncharacterized protein (DUF433 family)
VSSKAANAGSATAELSWIASVLSFSSMADVRDRIERNPAVLGGKPIVRGTRIAVEHVLAMLAEGVSEADICKNHPRLSPEDVRACVAYAAAAVRGDAPSAA